MKLGTMQYILSGDNDVDRFAHAARLGFSGIEAEISRQDLKSAQTDRLSSLRLAKSRTGLAIPSLCLGGSLIGSDDQAARQADITGAKWAVDWAVELGAKVILLAFFFDTDLKTPQSVSLAADGFRQICGYAKDKGVKITYEGTFTAEKVHELAKAVNSPAFGDYFDLANVVWLGMDTADQIRKRGSLIAQVHFKDSREGPGDCHPGQGRVNYAESAKALREVGYDGWLVFEVPKGSDQEIRSDIATARKYFEVES